MSNYHDYGDYGDYNAPDEESALHDPSRQGEEDPYLCPGCNGHVGNPTADRCPGCGYPLSDAAYWTDRSQGGHPDYNPETDPFAIWPGGHPLDRMGKTATWQVVSLGELQQPGAVGATEEYNPVVDGPNPDGPGVDNAGNSPEQEVALETWVNAAIDMINRGEQDQAIIAKLSHDGCPFPQEALKRAKEQPNQSAVTNELGQDPFEAPSPDQQNPIASGQMQGLSQQPPAVTGSRVRVAGSTMTGKVDEVWTDMWGQGLVRISLDEGGSVNVAPEAVESIDETPRQPVSEIQQFIDSLPKVEPSRPNIEARVGQLELVRQAVRNTISKVGFSDQVKLSTIDRDAQDEILVLRTWLSSNLTGEVVTQPYRYNGFGVADSNPDAVFAGNVREAAVIWASEGPWDGTNGSMKYAGAHDDLIQAAAHYAETHNMTGDQLNTFIKAAEEYVGDHRHVTTEEFDAEPDNDGPVEQLFA
jgi:hypothetical protein